MTFDQLLNLLEYKKEEKKNIRDQIERRAFTDGELTKFMKGYLIKLIGLERELVQRVLTITNTVIRDFSMEALYHAPTHQKIKEVHYQLLEYQDRIQDLPQDMRGRLKSKVESYNIVENPIYKDYDKLYEIFFKVAQQDQPHVGAGGAQTNAETSLEIGEMTLLGRPESGNPKGEYPDRGNNISITNHDPSKSNQI